MEALHKVALDSWFEQRFLPAPTLTASRNKKIMNAKLGLCYHFFSLFK